MSELNNLTAKLHLRLSQADAHYGGNLVDGAKILALFGDVATELLIRIDGDEGLFVAYELVEFKAPVFAGDFIEVFGKITKMGNTSRKIEFAAYKIIEANINKEYPSQAKVLEPPLLVTKAIGTCMVPKHLQRKGD